MKSSKTTIRIVSTQKLTKGLAQIDFQRFKVGTVFEGKSDLSLTIGELLGKKAKF